MMQKLEDVLKNLDAKEQIKLLEAILETVSGKDSHDEEIDAIKRAAAYAADIASSVNEKDLVDLECVKRYNKYVVKAFPEKFKKEEEQSPQNDKPDSEHNPNVKASRVELVEMLIKEMS